jgi:MOSC domain-containing protein YiiM
MRLGQTQRPVLRGFVSKERRLILPIPFFQSVFQSCVFLISKTSNTRLKRIYGVPLKLLSLNVSRPRLAVYKGTTVNTGIFKQPVLGPVPLRTLNLDGDRQADLSVHGGPNKAVYGYPSEHYSFWQQELPGRDLPWGMFGENFTTEGLSESELHIGDRLRIGTAVLMVRQPRIPCYKLAVKFQRDDMLERFLGSGRSGFYFSVEQEGTVTVGDSFEFLVREQETVTIEEMNRLIAHDRYNLPLLEKAIATPALPEQWREYLSQRLASTGARAI